MNCKYRKTNDIHRLNIDESLVESSVGLVEQETEHCCLSNQYLM